MISATLLFGPASAFAHRVKSINLTINDTNVAKCENVTARVTVCVQVQKEDLVTDAAGNTTGKAKVPIRIVYDEWGEDSDYEGAQGDVSPVCQKDIEIDFLPVNVGADICREFVVICQFHASTYDYGWTTDPDFYACARSSLNSAPNMYSGEVEIEFGDEAGKQTVTASIVPTGGPHSTVVALAADLPPVSSLGFTVSFDPRTTAVLAVAPHAGFVAEETEPGTWQVKMAVAGGEGLKVGATLVSFQTEVYESALSTDARQRGGASAALAEVEITGPSG
ncbi:MAG: hypothetical protein HC897_20395, partial [Thermoanaerobaculia bacterium]|nr:hypothetical protein [Thermoanaerobaculia bacterium]